MPPNNQPLYASLLQVLVVVTHNDKLGKLVVSTDVFHMRVEEWVRDMAVLFKGIVDLDEGNLFFVDATDKQDSNFTRFEGHAIKLFRDRIRQVVQVPAVCDATAKALGEESGGQRLLLTADMKKGMDSVPEFKCYCEEVDDEKGTMLLPADMHDPQRLLDGVPQEACVCYPDWNVKKGKKRGLAVIISMEKYDLACAERSGGSEDRENLKALAHSLDFEVHVMVDFTADDVLQSLRTIANESILEEHESFLCFANGHGGSTDDKYELHYLKDENGDMLFLDDIVRPFRRCAHLQGKPKLLFVNSCRGSNKLRMDEQQCGSSVQQATSSQQVRKEASEYEYVKQIKDCLIFFSTSGRSVSTRKPGVGTSFGLALKNAFTNRRQVLDVLGIVCCATNEVAAEEHKWRNETSGEVETLGQWPVHVSSLTKLLYWR